MHDYDIDAMSIGEVVDRIIVLNDALRRFWGRGGWASGDAARILSESRLDWHVSLSHALKLWIDPPSAEMKNAHQILGYASLGSLVEGSMKLFLSVYHHDYERDPNVVADRNGTIIDPDRLQLEPLRQFFKKTVWVSGLDDNWDKWIERVQTRRNAIHAYRDRPIGTCAELIEDIRNYLRFICTVNSRLPYPDGSDGPGVPIEFSDVYLGAEAPRI
jgi:hypothetical protein